MNKNDELAKILEKSNELSKIDSKLHDIFSEESYENISKLLWDAQKTLLHNICLSYLEVNYDTLDKLSNKELGMLGDYLNDTLFAHYDNIKTQIKRLTDLKLALVKLKI